MQREKMLKGETDSTWRLVFFDIVRSLLACLGFEVGLNLSTPSNGCEHEECSVSFWPLVVSAFF